MIYQILFAYFDYKGLHLTEECEIRLYERTQAANHFKSSQDSSQEIAIDEMVADWFEDPDLPKPDITLLNGMLTFSPKAFNVIKEFIPESAEIFSIKLDNEVWHAINFTEHSDNLIKTISDEITLTNASYDKSVTAELSFRDDIELPELLHIKAANGRFYCGEKLKKCILANGLTGITLTENLIVADYSLI